VPGSLESVWDLYGEKAQTIHANERHNLFQNKIENTLICRKTARHIIPSHKKSNALV
jgi:hypothetical protein